MIKHRTTCRICYCKDLDKVIPLKPIPVVTPNMGVTVDPEAKETLRAPLDVYLCRDCGHLQLLDIIDPTLQYTHFKYRTSTSLGLVEHFDLMAERIIHKCRLSSKSFVIEIGSNDGTLLKAFKRRGMKVLGIDPAIAIAEQARADGVDTLPLFFNHQVALEIKQGYGQADVIVCTNTMANIDDLDNFFGGIDTLLKRDGVFVFETQYGADVIRKQLIDTIYHEHLSYFMVGPLSYLCKRHGFHLKSIEHFETKGGSIRGYVRRDGKVADPDVYKAMSMEIERHRDSKAYTKFVEWIETTAVKLDEALKDRKSIAGFGASVGTVTLLNQFNLGSRLKLIMDDHPITDCLRGLDYNIPIMTPIKALFADDSIDTVVVFAWRYAKQIIARYRETIESGQVEFIVPWPGMFIHKGKPSNESHPSVTHEH